MRIDRIEVRGTPPVRHFAIDTSSNIVIIAGANGSGKTRLKEAVINSFRNPGAPQASLILGATRPQEVSAWGGQTLEVKAGTPCPKLQQYLNGRTRGSAYVGTVIQIDSDRSVQQIQYQPLSAATPDPDDQEMNYSYYLSPFGGRWTSLMNRIHQKVASRDHKLATHVKSGPPNMTFAEARRSIPDPFTTYQQIFAQLLPGKTLEPINTQQPGDLHYKIGTSSKLTFRTLSSGEQEVVKVAFDLVSKQISHSVIFLDEPELHLHPTLTFRLLEALKTLGGGTNQFVFLTHSADLISTYYATGNVFFIDAVEPSDNQARQLSNLAASHASTARAVAANLGLFAVGKKLIFIEGRDASADRVVYHRVAQKVFSDAYLLPVGSVDNLNALRNIVSELDRAIFGVGLFMIRDRDGLAIQTVGDLEKSPRMRCLPRRHLENYLLDEDILGEVASQFYLEQSKRQPGVIKKALEESAGRSLMPAVLAGLKEWVRLYGSLSHPRIPDAGGKSLDELVREVTSQMRGSRAALLEVFDDAAVDEFMRQEHSRLAASLSDGSWRSILPGKWILADFCGSFWHTELARVREAYADIAILKKPVVFSDIESIMAHFATLN